MYCLQKHRVILLRELTHHLNRSLKVLNGDTKASGLKKEHSLRRKDVNQH